MSHRTTETFFAWQSRKSWWLILQFPHNRTSEQLSPMRRCPLDWLLPEEIDYSRGYTRWYLSHLRNKGKNSRYIVARESICYNILQCVLPLMWTGMLLRRRIGNMRGVPVWCLVPILRSELTLRSHHSVTENQIAALMTTGIISCIAMFEIWSALGHCHWNHSWVEEMAPQPHDPDTSESTEKECCGGGMIDRPFHPSIKRSHQVRSALHSWLRRTQWLGCFGT